jgi:hypothetical protein
MRIFFNGKYDRSGANLAFAGTRQSANITASSTDKLFIPTPNRRAAITALGVSVDTVPIGGGTITGIFHKYDASADAAVALNTLTDLETLVTKEGRTVALLSTLTDAQRTLDDGDTIYFEVTSSGTVTTQPTNLCASVELAVLE